jgi:hypothetical protein
MKRYVLVIPKPTPLLNQWQRWHFRKRTRECQEWAWLVKAAMNGARLERPPPLKRCRIHVDRFSTQAPDWDNLYGGLKPVLDALVVMTKRNPHGIGLIEDDNPAVVKALTALWHPCKPNEGKSQVVIEELPLALAEEG